MNKQGNILRDKRLVELLLAGNVNALSELMDNYYDAIFFTVLKMVNNRQDADDLTIEVFQKVYLHIEMYSSEFAFSTWLFRIASNICIDFLRKKKGNFVSIDEDKNTSSELTVSIANMGPAPDEMLINKQSADELRNLVEKLKPFWQQLIEMRYYKELSYEEIADQLQVPMGTVKNQLYRAKDQLAKLYTKHKR